MKTLIGTLTALLLSATLYALPYVETARLAHSPGAAYDEAAYGVAIDGDVAVVGKPINGLGNPAVGQAYVFVRSGGVWSEAAQLVPSDSAIDDAFGASVAISGDTIAVGANAAALGDTSNAGKVYVFLKPGGGWTGTVNESAQLVNPNPDLNAAYLGKSVATTGGVVVAGAPGLFQSNEGAGFVFVFVRPDSGWSGTINPSAVLSASDGVFGDALGFSVGLSGDVVVAGAPFARGSDGEGYVWTKPGGGWAGPLSESAKLFPASPAFNGFFGISAAIDGQTVALSDLSGNDPTAAQGFVFVEPGGGWAGTLTENADLAPTDSAKFAPAANTSIAVSGARVVLGEPGAPSPGNGYTGAAYVFDRPISGWSGTVSNWAKVYPNAPQFAWFGWSAAMSGTRILVGAAAETVNGNIGQGAAHVFDEGLNPTVTVSFSPGSVYTFQPSTFSLSVTNPNTTGFLSNLEFAAAQSTPSGLAIDAVPNVSNTCGGLNILGYPPFLVGMFRGNLPASSSCGLSVNVSSGLPNTYTTGILPSSTYIPFFCDQGCYGVTSNTATLLVRLRPTQIRVLVQGPIRVAPGVPVEFRFQVDALQRSSLPLSGEVTVSDGAGHSCVADVSALGDGSCHLTFGSPGTFHVTAQYEGNLAFAASTSPPKTVLVGSPGGAP